MSLDEKTNLDADITWEKDPNIFIFLEEIAGRHKMHVKNLNLHDWVQIDGTYVEQMKAKKGLYETNMNDIFVSRENDESTELCKWEFFDMLTEHLLTRYPNIFTRTDNGDILNRVTKKIISTKREEEEDPLLRAGKLTQDDWIILQYDSELSQYVLTAGILCFPSNWDIHEKFNKPLDGIHGPVKPYLEHLKDKVNSLLRRIKPEQPMWRANWGIYGPLHGTADLFLHPKKHLHQIEEEGSVKIPFEGKQTGNTLFLRCEYQTLRKLPITKCMVFGIRTYQRYLQDLRNHPCCVAKSLLRSIENLDEEYLSYKGGDVWKEATMGYLNLIIAEKEKENDESGTVFPVSRINLMKIGFVLASVSCIALIYRRGKIYNTTR